MFLYIQTKVHSNIPCKQKLDNYLTALVFVGACAFACAFDGWTGFNCHSFINILIQPFVFKALKKVQELEDTTESLRTENQSNQQVHKVSVKQDVLPNCFIQLIISHLNCGLCEQNKMSFKKFLVCSWMKRLCFWRPSWRNSCILLLQIARAKKSWHTWVQMGLFLQ